MDLDFKNCENLQSAKSALPSQIMMISGSSDIFKVSDRLVSNRIEHTYAESTVLYLDINECVEKTANCSNDENAICTNEPGTYNCACKNGYKQEGDECVGK